MSLNIATLKTRALTAIVFVAVMLLGIMYNEWSFKSLFLIIQFGCIFEFLKLIQLINPGYNKWPMPILKYMLFGILYLVVPFYLMRTLYDNSHFYFEGPNWVLPMMIIASIWINDTMAYLVGSIIGKHALSAISPKKTWEGTIGGSLLAVVIVTWVATSIWSFSVKYVLIISASAAIAGTFGDLLESKIKRAAGVKDSGQIMPGHGGFLDRFDSLLIAIMAVWLVLYLFL